MNIGWTDLNSDNQSVNSPLLHCYSLRQIGPPLRLFVYLSFEFPPNLSPT